MINDPFWSSREYFLALCSLDPAKPNGPTGLFFVNNTDEQIEQLAYETGGSMTIDDDPITTDVARRAIGTVPPRSSVLFEYAGEDDFEMIAQWDFVMTFAERQESLRFVAGKYLQGAVRSFRMPVVNRDGRAILPD